MHSLLIIAFFLHFSCIFHPIQILLYYCFLLVQLRAIFPNDVKCFVHNDAVAAMASGTMGKLHGCVLIAGTGTIAYGYTEDGREARASGAGPVLGDWGRYDVQVLFMGYNN